MCSPATLPQLAHFIIFSLDPFLDLQPNFQEKYVWRVGHCDSDTVCIAYTDIKYQNQNQ